MKRSLTVGVIVVLILSLVAFTAGCGSMEKGSAIKKKTTVTFWHAMSGDHEKALKKIAEDFNKANEKYIQVELVYQGTYNDLRTKLTASLAAGKPPTMAQMYENWTSAFIQADALVPVKTLIDDPNHGMKPDEVNDFYKVFRDQNTFNGTLYTLPMNKSTNVLFYNTDLVPKAPTTWQEFRDAAKKATRPNADPKKAVYGFGLRPGGSVGIDIFGYFLKQNGGTWLGSDGKAAFNGKEGQEAMQFLYDLVNKDKSAINLTSYESDALGGGQIAMYIGSIAGIPYVAKAAGDKVHWGIAKLPKGKIEASTVMGTNVGIFKKATSAEQEAAWRFIKFLLSPENTAYWASVTGYVPVRESATKTKTFQDMVQAKPYWQAIAEQLKVSTIDPNMAEWDKVRTDVSGQVEKILLKKVEIKKGLDDAAAKTNEDLGKK